MKKIVIVLLGMFLLTSCVNETEDNTPTLQAKFNSVSWKAKETSVSLDANGGLVIKAYRGSEVLTLKTSALSVGSYTFGTQNLLNSASYAVGTGLNVAEYKTSIVLGPAFGYETISAGTGYVLNNSAMTTSISPLSTGAGLVFKIEEVNGLGAISKLSIKARGANYKAGDIVTVQGGANNAKYKVLNVQQSNGKVVIEKIENGTITGNFQLNAVNADGEVVTFSEGTFYQVPMN